MCEPIGRTRLHASIAFRLSLAPPAGEALDSFVIAVFRALEFMAHSISTCATGATADESALTAELIRTLFNLVRQVAHAGCALALASSQIRVCAVWTHEAPHVLSHLLLQLQNRAAQDALLEGDIPDVRPIHHPRHVRVPTYARLLALAMSKQLQFRNILRVASRPADPSWRNGDLAGWGDSCHCQLPRARDAGGQANTRISWRERQHR